MMCRVSDRINQEFINTKVEDVICGQKITISNVMGDEADELVEVLLEEGVQAATIEEYRLENEAEQEIFAHSNSEKQMNLWDKCKIVVWFSQPEKEEFPFLIAENIITQCMAKMNMPFYGLQLRREYVYQTDYEEQVKSEYHPICVVEGLWIVPTWCNVEDPQALNIRLRPGLAFGTGNHPTTRLCLKWLYQSCDLKGKDVLDYGTGSGVLAIGGKLFGAKRCVGVDIDPLSIVAARENARFNGLDEHSEMFWYQCNEERQKEAQEEEEELLLSKGTGYITKFDIVVVNILLGPLVNLAPKLNGYLKPEGRLALSGILTTQVEELRLVYDVYLKDIEIWSEGEWALLTGITKNRLA